MEYADYKRKEEEERKEQRFHEKVLEGLKDIIRLLHKLTDKPVAKFAKLAISDSKGNVIMPATLAVGKTATAVLREFVDASMGQELAPVGPVSYTSSDPSVATVDAVTGLITAVAPGSATITGLDSGNNLSASDTVSDTPLVASFATLTITPN